MTMANYDLVVGRSNFLLISASALFILLFIIIAYYIYQFNNPNGDNLFNVIQSSNQGQKIRSASSSSSSHLPSSVLAKSSLNSNAAPVTGSNYHIATKPTTPEVFNVGENIYSYDQAEAVCKALNSEVATYDQIVAASQKGANWCNYGWSADQRVLYPVQKSVWKRMQNNYGGSKGACGKMWPGEFKGYNFGVQGGYQPNGNMQYGVNCYGVKEAPLSHESAKQNMKSDKEMALDTAVAQLQSKRDGITVLPFNQDLWSGLSS